MWVLHCPSVQNQPHTQSKAPRRSLPPLNLSFAGFYHAAPRHLFMPWPMASFCTNISSFVHFEDKLLVGFLRFWWLASHCVLLMFLFDRRLGTRKRPQQREAADMDPRLRGTCCYRPWSNLGQHEWCLLASVELLHIYYYFYIFGWYIAYFKFGSVSLGSTHLYYFYFSGTWFMALIKMLFVSYSHLWSAVMQMHIRSFVHIIPASCHESS